VCNVEKKNETIKNYSPQNNFNDIQPISKNIEPILFKPNGNEIALNYKIDNDVPHGCLKNGIKPCYKSWKNKGHFTPPITTTAIIKEYTDKDQAKGIIESEINKAINSKTEFSTELIEKYHKEDKPLNILEDVSIGSITELTSDDQSPSLIQDIQTLDVKLDTQTLINTSDINIQSLDGSLDALDALDKTDSQLDVQMDSFVENDSEEPEIKKIQVKRLIKRNYTLGKNKNKVGILIKNKKSRKKIVDYTKELKKMTNEDIKKHLRDHGLIKIGSAAPPEIVRKIFENVKMAGDIINEDKDILLHNLLNENVSN
jgi:hypothetical protein